MLADFPKSLLCILQYDDTTNRITAIASLPFTEIKSSRFHICQVAKRTAPFQDKRYYISVFKFFLQAIQITLAEQDSRLSYISFSRNFGKEAAMYAGFRNAIGDYVAVMDADLQDPPHLLLCSS